jgi:type VI protein secretion system component VasF
MSELDNMDRLLHSTLSATAPPKLSPAFDSRLKRRLRPRRLSPAGRLIMVAYALLMLVACVWAMRSESINWGLVAIAILTPFVPVLAVQARQRPRGARGRQTIGQP